MKNLILLLTIMLLVCACKRSEARIAYDENAKGDQNANLMDTETGDYKKLIADLPFSFDSVKYLYFPLGETNESFKMNLRSFSSSYSNTSKSYSLGYMRGSYINCNLDNLMIRPKDSSTFKLLTHSDIKIKSINYLYRIDTIHGVDKLIYKVVDADSNKDSYINDDDLVGLYTSRTNGNDFKRISPANQQLIDWETTDLQGLLYFRTMEDIDKNGMFDDKDRINLYEYDLVKEDTIKLIFNARMYPEMK